MAEGLDLGLPDLDCGTHLIDYLFEIGPAAVGGMGPAPVSHMEIQAWQANTGIGLGAWEARLLRRLSSDYVDESFHAQKADRPAPVAPAVDREAVSKAIGNAFKALAASRRRA